MKNLKNDFPIFKNQKQPYVYLDSAATSHKPQVVIDAMANFYAKQYATVGRSMYHLAEQATQMVADVRKQVADFIGAQADEIIFTKGATEGLNFVAATYGMQHCKEGDEIVLTEMEHHANLLPWQQVALKTGAKLRFIPVTKDVTLDLENLDEIITKKTKFVSVVHVSNAFGTHNDIARIIKRAHEVGARILIDTCQSIPHKAISVAELKPDFLVVSGHKILGPTGIGILYIRKEVQEFVQPYQFGGGMVFEAFYEHAKIKEDVHRYETGTLPIAQIIGLGAALDYFQKNIHGDELINYEASLMKRMIEGLQQIPQITLLGPLEQLKKEGHLVSFRAEGHHPHDVAAYLDKFGIAVRAGDYCVQPLVKKLGGNRFVRASVYLYNTPEDIDYFISIMQRLFAE